MGFIDNHAFKSLRIGLKFKNLFNHFPPNISNNLTTLLKKKKLKTISEYQT